MDLTPSTSKASPVKKRTRLNLGHLSVSEKQCILNMYKQILSDTSQMKLNTIFKKIKNTAGDAKLLSDGEAQNMNLVIEDNISQELFSPVEDRNYTSENEVEYFS
ncbi:hypothetical protein FQA39_LY02480 [Lamprigera yunnana]|nr:hypothetical protein FQA39_LY02480 [Lamprigera yunnana]